MTELEKKFAQMTPVQQRQAAKAISDQMGMPLKKNRSKKKQTGKKK